MKLLLLAAVLTLFQVIGCNSKDSEKIEEFTQGVEDSSRVQIEEHALRNRYNIGDSVVVEFGEYYWRNGIVIGESESGRVYIEVFYNPSEKEYGGSFKQYFNTYRIEKKP